MERMAEVQQLPKVQYDQAAPGTSPIEKVMWTKPLTWSRNDPIVLCVRRISARNFTGRDL